MRRVRVTLVVIAALSAACGAFLGLDDPIAAEPPPDASSDGGVDPRVDGAALVDGGDSASGCAPACVPEGVIKLPGAVLALARTATGLVVAHGAPNGGAIVRFDIDANGLGGAPVDLDPTCGVPDCPSSKTSVAVHPSGIYWGTQNALKVARPDGGVETIGTESVINGLAIEKDKLWWVKGASVNQSKLVSCDLPNCTPNEQPATLSQSIAWATDVRPTGGFVFLRFGGSASIEKAIREKDNAAHVATSEDVGRLAAAAGSVVVRVGSTLRHVMPSQAQVLYAPDGGAPIAAVVADPPFVYFARGSSIERCLLDEKPCTPTLLATSPGTLVAFDTLIVDATHLYWGMTSGEIVRLAKP